MGSRELWFGKNQWEQRVETVLIHADVWPSFAWRVEWGQPPNRAREVFTGADMETRARAFLATKQAELGTDWQLARRS